MVGQLRPQSPIKRLRRGDPLEKEKGFVRTLDSEPLAATVRHPGAWRAGFGTNGPGGRPRAVA